MKTKHILIGIVVLAVAIGAAWYFVQGGEANELTAEAAFSALSLGGGAEGCVEGGIPEVYRSCIVEISKSGEIWNVRITHDGFFDDSVKASRIDAEIAWENERWTVKEVSQMVQCQPNRGHQDFSEELCV